MLILLRLLAIAGALACATTPARATFINYEQWQTMPADIRAGFVIGAFDDMAGLVRGDDPYLEANTRGLSACSVGMGLSAGMMVKMIDFHYESDPDARQRTSAVAALHVMLMRVCKSYINTVRLEERLEKMN